MSNSNLMFLVAYMAAAGIGVGTLGIIRSSGRRTSSRPEILSERDYNLTPRHQGEREKARRVRQMARGII